MPFIGNQPTETYSTLTSQAITGNGGTGYTLTKSVTSPEDIEVFINHVRQKPGTSYSVSGTTITFTEAVAATDDCYAVYQGRTVATKAPGDNSVGTGKIQANAVTDAKLATSLDFQNITVKGGSNNAMTIDSSGAPIFPNKPAFEAWFTGSNQAINSGTNVTFVYNNVEQQGGTNFSTTTGKFTVPVSGIYFFALLNNVYNVNANNYARHGVLFNGTGFSTDEQHILGFWTVGDTGDHTMSSSFVRKLTAADTVQPFIRTEDASEASAGRMWQNFSGFLVG